MPRQERAAHTWDPIRILDVEATHPDYFNCVGTTTKGYRCKNRIAKDNAIDGKAILQQLHQPPHAPAALIGDLGKAADKLLCQKNHWDQVDDVVEEWTQAITEWAEQHQLRWRSAVPSTAAPQVAQAVAPAYRAPPVPTAEQILRPRVPDIGLFQLGMLQTAINDVAANLQPRPAPATTDLSSQLQRLQIDNTSTPRLSPIIASQAASARTTGRGLRQSALPERAPAAFGTASSSSQAITAPTATTPALTPQTIHASAATQPKARLPIRATQIRTSSTTKVAYAAPHTAQTSALRAQATESRASVNRGPSPASSMPAVPVASTGPQPIRTPEPFVFRSVREPFIFRPEARPTAVIGHSAPRGTASALSTPPQTVRAHVLAPQQSTTRRVAPQDQVIPAAPLPAAVQAAAQATRQAQVISAASQTVATQATAPRAHAVARTPSQAIPNESRDRPAVQNTAPKPAPKPANPKLPKIKKPANQKDATLDIRIEQLKTRECPICFEDFEDPCETPCGHVFCSECAKSWIGGHSNCPSCRRPMTLEPLVLLTDWEEAAAGGESNEKIVEQAAEEWERKNAAK